MSVGGTCSIVPRHGNHFILFGNHDIMESIFFGSGSRVLDSTRLLVIYSVFDWLSTQTLEPNCLGSNSSFCHFWLHDLRKVTLSSCALVFFIYKMEM